MITKLTEGDDFLDLYLKDKNLVILSSISNEFSELALNWYLSLKIHNLHENALVIALDSLCYQKLKNYNIPCVLFETNIGYNNIDDLSSITSRFNVISYILKKYQLDVIHSDVDVVFLKNPLEKLKEEKQGYDCAIMSNRLTIKNINDPYAFLSYKNENGYGIDPSTGDYYAFLYAEYNNPVIQTWLDIFSFDFTSLTHQILTNNLSEGNNVLIDSVKTCLINGNHHPLGLALECAKRTNLKLKILDRKYFSLGAYLTMNKFYTKDKILENAYVLHYNQCVWDEENLENIKNKKIELMKQNNHWYVD